MENEKLSPGRSPPDSLYVFIEARRGSRIIYRYNMDFDNLVLFRMLNKEFPFCYGRVPKTHHTDTGALDVFVLSSENLELGSIVSVRPVAYLRAQAGSIVDDKIVAVLEGDVNFKEVKDLKDIPSYILKQIEEFLKENEVYILEWFDIQKTRKIIVKAIELYKQMR